MTADEIWMPLDPSVLLVMGHPDTQPRVGKIPMDGVEAVNKRIAWECDEWVVARPENPQVESLAAWLRGQPAPRMRVGGPTPAEWADMGKRMRRRTTDEG